MGERAIEIKVGFFLLLGLAAVATMIIIFGRFEESFKPTYSITVHFANAQGLLKGTTVTLAGSPIGRIKAEPHPFEDDKGNTEVAVDLRIEARYKIKAASKFRIVAVGMLGDKAIDVLPHPNVDSIDPHGGEILKDGDIVEGSSNDDALAGLTNLMESAKPTMDQIHGAAVHIHEISRRVDTDVMTPQTAGDLRESIKKFRSVLTRIDLLLAQAQQGKGALAKILNDPKMADDIASFISNIRRKGVLFYSDQSAKEKEEADIAAKEKGKIKP